MLFNRFIDRDQELRELSLFFFKARGLRKVALVTGPSGIGKSEFTHEFARRIGNPLFIRVSCPIAPCDKTLRDGAFIRNLSEQVHCSAPRIGLPTFESFANTVGTPALREHYNRALMEDGRGITTLAAAHAGLQILKRKRGRFFVAGEMFRQSASWEPIIHRDYVLHALREKEVTLALENFQLIDHESLVYVHDLMRSMLKASWIVEYTPVAGNEPELRAFDDFQRLCEHRAKMMVLTPVPLTSILAAKGNVADTEAQIIERQYRDHKGNLRALIDTSALLRDMRKSEALRAKMAQPDKTDPTEVLLETSDPGQLFLLAVLLANDARVEIFIVEAIFRSRAQQLGLGNFGKCCAEAISEGLIEEDEICHLRISHDSISKAFVSASSRKVLLVIALKASDDYYEGLVQAGQFDSLSEREVTARLLKIRLQTEPLMIFAHFRSLRDAVLRSASRQEAARFLQAAIAALRKETGLSEDVWWRLAHLCYEANLFQPALGIAAEKQNGVRWRLLRGLLFHNLDLNDEGIREAELAYAQTSTAGARLTAQLVRMVCFRASARLSQAAKIAEEIEREPTFHGEPEYAYFLRNLEFLSGLQDGLSLALKSVRILTALGLESQVNKARITLAMQMARLGQTDAALSELSAVEEHDGLPISDRHMIWNNRCAVEMMRRNWGAKQGFILERARLVCALDFDRIVIGNNLALWHAHNRRFADALRCFAEICPLLQVEDDARVRCALLFNQAEVAKLGGDDQTASAWISKLRSETRRVDGSYRGYWEARLQRGFEAQPEFSFLLSLPFHYTFLAHWSFPLREDIEG